MPVGNLLYQALQTRRETSRSGELWGNFNDFFAMTLVLSHASTE
ncbi:hypothetical protein M2337_002730 [Sphingobium sp. B2D3A]|nr:hypothetical protein [Sphingobium sp. B2D3A]MCW2384955.1 hypothetical protein [Sphingobium sp. B2D3D]